MDTGHLLAQLRAVASSPLVVPEPEPFAPAAYSTARRAPPAADEVPCASSTT
ncbi:hypothetical protein AKJ09_01224 [Labilithrix luteola]|uniref:Uncharacterized protein n=1 Tax=Labilithrix luteola TaxID=1391654 RepID=A0A0K1PM10_9BACT|nr:hypothetical protein AKJ09_01224 [Labilithrix luteola]